MPLTCDGTLIKYRRPRRLEAGWGLLPQSRVYTSPTGSGDKAYALWRYDFVLIKKGGLDESDQDTYDDVVLI